MLTLIIILLVLRSLTGGFFYRPFGMWRRPPMGPHFCDFGPHHGPGGFGGPGGPGFGGPGRF